MAFDVKKYYEDLGKLFKSGNIVRQRVASKIAAPGDVGVPIGTARAFLKHVNNAYTSALASYGQYSRLARYSDYNEMESMPEISSALNLYAEEVCSGGENDEILKIESPNIRIREALNTLFYDVLNIDFNARAWVRNFCKYGDQFMLVDHHPDYGVLNVLPMPVNEIEREEGYDKNDPTAYRYRWVTQGNRILENWQVVHFRLWGNDNFLPYGSSILEPARRVWRQLILMEDAVMVYRIVRCLHGQSKVWTNEGYKLIKDIKVGDNVYSFDEKNKKFVLSPVTDWVNNGKQQIWSVTSKHRFIKANATHPVLVRNKKNNEISYVEVQNLEPKKYQIVAPYFDNSDNVKDVPIKLKEDKYEMFAYLGDEGANLFKESSFDDSKRQLFLKCEEKFKYPADRIKQFLYRQHDLIKGIPEKIAESVCSEFNIPSSLLKKYPIGMFNLDRISLPENVNSDFARFFGFMLGDGFLTSNYHSIGFSSGIHEDINKQYSDLLGKYCSKMEFSHDKRNIHPQVGKYYVNSEYFAHLMEDMGFTNSVYTKRIPSWVYQLPTTQKEQFLLGFMDADGWIKKSGNLDCAFEVELCNKELVEDIKELCHQVGWNVSAQLHHREKAAREMKNGNVIKETDSWTIYLSKSKNNNEIFEDVLSVEKTSEYADVYDIRVDNDLHNFIADGIVVHNSPERRVFYIGVGNVAPQDVPAFVEKAKTQLKRNQIVDSQSGRVDLRYNPMCYFPNDYVYLANGTRIQVKEIATNFEKYKNCWVWSLNEQNNVVPTKLIWAGKTRDKTKFIEVTLDDGQTIRTTPNHKWILRDGSSVEAKDLKSNMAVMPFYCQKNQELSKRFGDSKNNFYVDYYNPGSKKWMTGHKIVAQFKYGNYAYPDIIHHENHIKYNNDFDNLTKMTQAGHMVEHAENVKRLNEYAKTELGRANSSKNMKENWAKGLISGDTTKELWKNKEIRQKRIESLTLKTDSVLIKFVGKALSALGSESREYQVRDFLNNDAEFIAYLVSLNSDFKNGFNDKLTKNQFRYALRKNNFNNLREVKDFYAALRAPWDKVVEYCAVNNPKTRKEIFEYFNISKYDFNRLIKSHGLTGIEFDNQFLGGGYYKVAKLQVNLNDGEYKNHTIISVKESDFECEAYGLTVENSTHIVAIGGSNASTLSLGVPKSGVFIRQSTDEDYFIPVRGEGDGTRIDTLPGGQFTGDIDDLVYIQNKLFAALKVPKSYLGYEGDINAKSTLSQEDVRFARTIRHIQKMFLAELNKIAILHLYSMGFAGEDLVNFELTMANPSTIAELQRLELWRTRFEVASMAQEGMFDRYFIYNKLFGLSDDEIEGIEEGRRRDKLFDIDLESIVAAGLPPPVEDEQSGAAPGGAGPDGPGAPEAGLPAPPGQPGANNVGLDTAGKDPNKQTAAPNELIKVNTGHKSRKTMPDLYKHAFNMKKTAMDPKRSHSELTRSVKAPFGEASDPEERLFTSRVTQLKKFAEDLTKVPSLNQKNTKKIISD